MAFLPSLRQLAATWKLPLIFVGSPPLREMSILFASVDTSELSPPLIERQMRRSVLPSSRRCSDGDSTAYGKQKELKKRGFNAIIRWCAYHQEVLDKNCDGKPDGRSGADDQEAKCMDVAVVRWVMESRESFSCGQSLVVLTFLCDVLQRKKQESKDKPSSSSSSAAGDLTAQLTHTVALLMAQAVTCEQLQLQPFFILLSAVYGLTRITNGNPLNLSPDVLESLVPPSPMWHALLYQLRAFYAVAGDAGESLDASINAGALLTVMFLFEKRRCNEFFAQNDYKMMERLVCRLVRLLQPALRASREARLCKDEGEKLKATAAEGVFVNEADGEEDRCFAEEGDSMPVSHSDGDVSLLSLRNRICLQDCCRILHHTRAPVECRVDLMEFFLCVMHDPAALTDAEVRQLPVLFGAAHALWDVKRTGLAEYVARASRISKPELLAPLLPFMGDPGPAAAMIEEQLSQNTLRLAKLDADLATHLLSVMGSRLPRGFRTLLVRWSLANSPEVLCAVEDALESRRRNSSKGSVDSSDELEVSRSLTASPVHTHAKVLLSPELCLLLRFLFFCGLSSVPIPPPRHLEEAKYEAYTEALTIVGAVVRSIDWPKCAPKQLEQEGNSLYETHLSTYSIAFSVLTVYLQSHDVYHFLTPEDRVEDRALLNTFVLPLLRNSEPCNRARVLRLLRQVLPHLQSLEYQRQLVHRALLYGSTNTYSNLFFFVRLFVVPATELQVFPDALMKFIFRQRTLMPRMLPRWMMAKMNFSKAYTTVLVRVVRYVFTSGVLMTSKGGIETLERRERVALWFGHYFSTVSSEFRSSDFQSEKTAKFNEVAGLDRAGVAEEAANVEGETPASARDSTEDAETLQDDDATETEDQKNRSEKEEAESAGEEVEEDEGVADGVPIAESRSLDEPFTSPVTEEDFEEVLTLMLQTGCKASSRALTLIAQRLRNKAFVANSARAVSMPPEDSTVPTTGGVAPLSWLEESNMVTSDREWLSEALQLPLESLPLPAHFVFAVRADSALAIPITAPYLTALLSNCDILIFHHVLSAFFMLLKRRRLTAVLLHDMKIAEISMNILQKRLAECRSEHNMEGQSGGADVADELLSTIAFKSLVHLLFHFSQLPPRTPHLRAFLDSLNASTDTADEDATKTTPLEAKARERSSGTLSDGDDADDHNVLQLLRSTHANTASSVLQVSAFMTTLKLKEFTLAHQQRLAVLFPEAANFVFLQVVPQLSGFTQRELLQAATQYPAGEAEVLTELRRGDMHVSIDLSEFVPLAKKLPMRVVEAVLLAHAPHLTVAWVTRVLSALAARHEEMPVSLLHELLARVEAVADTACESDKSLLLLILQGYLLFGPSSPSASAEKRDEQTWMEDIYLAASTSQRHRAPLTPEAQRQRVELVLHCCDQLLSLERISTLEELRYFLVSYPPSLHQLRERGVVSKVEQKLLPAMLTASPIRLAELDTLVRLLSEHHVFLPHTAHMIADVLFAPPQLELLQRASFASWESDSASVLTRCLCIAIMCADAVHGTHTSNYPSGVFPLLLTVDTVLRVFDATQDWLIALTALLSPERRASNPAPSASSTNVFHASSSAPSVSFSLSASQIAVARHLCALLLRETDDLSPSAFTRLVHNVSRLKAWDLAMPQTIEQRVGHNARGTAFASADVAVDFPRVFCAMFDRADAHSRCVLLKAVANDPHAFRRFEAVVFRTLLSDTALLSAEDLETVLTAALQVSDAAIAEPLLDAVGTRLLPIMDQCRRSTLVRLLQCHSAFHIDDKVVVMAALAVLDRQSSVEVKLDAAQVIIVLEAVAQLSVYEKPERLIVLSFQRLEKLVQALSPVQLYQVGRLILDLEMGYIPCIHTLVTYILESRDGPRGHRDYQSVAEALCDVFDVEVSVSLRASRLRKRRQKERVRAFYAAQRKISCKV
ncbi:hypothetical protein ABL78_0323 [Leptomonas seymouri]|uniref:Uncharacterized protein n=1 Tax=Leptomonas seymouri TaxID=5684 RepID=A0A0N1I8Z6_LEPSE|nr:hypothetical protein ABL78_0323 [Leptomonas seymouri]|eukprot:KPI90563.1 hypothetical protein ABL78_0323 [Leptomonas seymouri]